MDNKCTLVAEVKRQRKNFHSEEFNEKVKMIRYKAISIYEIEAKELCIEDM